MRALVSTVDEAFSHSVFSSGFGGGGAADFGLAAGVFAIECPAGVFGFGADIPVGVNGFAAPGFGLAATGVLAVIFAPVFAVVFAVAALPGVGFGLGLGLGLAVDVVLAEAVFLTGGLTVWVKAGTRARPNSVSIAKNLIRSRRRFQNNITKLRFSPARRILAL